MEEYWQVIIPAIISIVGFYITYKSMKKQFMYSIEASMHKDRRELYVRAYKQVLRILENKKLVFSEEYNDELTQIWVEISISSEKEVVTSFDKFYKYVREIRRKYVGFYDENYWEQYDYDEMGNKIQLFTQWDIDRFDYLIEKYRNENQPNSADLEKFAFPILESMRKELKISK